MYSLSAPSKTFLVGEYLALKGRPVLLLQTEPRFVLEVKKSILPTSSPFHPQSAAGQFWQEHHEALGGYEFSFKDPHSGKGGFGGSSAEFLLIKSFFDLLQALNSGSELDLDLKDLLNTYWKLPCHQNKKPSGADLVGQRVGGLVAFTRDDGLLKKMSWPFADLEFRLVHTGVKLATHDHLKTLQDLSLGLLEEKAQEVILSMEQANTERFISGINEVSQHLEALGLLASHSKNLIQKIRNELPILAAKGCGAMGSDVVFILFEKFNESKIDNWLNTHSYYFIGSAGRLSGGLEVKEKEAK